MVCARPEQLQRTGKVFFCVEHLVSTRIAGGFLFRTLRVLNRLKPIMNEHMLVHMLILFLTPPVLPMQKTLYIRR